MSFLIGILSANLYAIKYIPISTSILLLFACNLHFILGGTLDITVHERGPQQAGIKEIHRVSGKDLGGQQVNKKFETLLENIFSQKIFNKIKHETPEYWMEIMEDFEDNKRIISEGNEYEADICIKQSKYSWESLKSRIDNYGSDIRIEGELLIIPPKVIKEMITDVCTSILQYFGGLRLPDVDAILMVGGFSNSNILQKMIKENFREIPVNIPDNGQLCVVKGAVMFGWKQDIIISRKSRYRYSLRLNDKNDPSSKLKQKVNYLSLVERDEDIRHDQSKTYEIDHNISNASYTLIELYRSVDEISIEQVGRFCLEKKERSRGNPIKLEIFFGDSEIRVEATDQTTGDVKEGRFKFFCQREVFYSD